MGATVFFDRPHAPTSYPQGIAPWASTDFHVLPRTAASGPHITGLRIASKLTTRCRYCSPKLAQSLTSVVNEFTLGRGYLSGTIDRPQPTHDRHLRFGSEVLLTA